jgi:hypothetical protein
MFRVEDRERIRALLVEKARADPRVVAAAAVGSSASGGDRWSDLDLTFGVADGAPVAEVLEDWTRTVVADFAAVVLFDLPFESTIYRVFLLPGALQVDLSFTPAAEFGARGPRFRLLFGEVVERPWTPAPTTEYLLGFGVHHAVRGHLCIERGRLWQAEYWISATRDQALTLACRRRGLDVHYGRGFDDLPSAVRDALAGSLVGELSVDELRRALAVATAGLLREAGDIPEVVGRVRSLVAEFCGPDSW